MPEISDEQRDATLANLLAMNAALEAEAQIRRDAEMWRRFAARCPSISGRLISEWAREDEQ